MADRRVPLQVLLNASARLWVRFLLLLGIGLVVPALVYQQWGWRELLPVAPSLATLFAVPLACAAVRRQRGVKLFSQSGLFCTGLSFLAGAAAASLFIGTLQLFQGMPASPADYGIAALCVGGIGVAISAIPGGGV